MNSRISRSAIITIGLLVLCLILMALLVWWLVYVPRVSTEAPLRSALTPANSEQPFTTLAGEAVNLEESFGNIVLVYSWASWCPQCVDGLVRFDTFVSALQGDDLKVTALAVNRAEDKLTAQRFIDTIPELQNVEIILDPSDQMFENVGGYAMPEILLFDDRGELLHHGRGQLDETTIQAIIDEHSS